MIPRDYYNSVKDIPVPGLELDETIEQGSVASDEENEVEENKGKKIQRVGFFNQINLVLTAIEFLLMLNL